MELTQDKIDLIAKIIKSDRKFSNNEDLYEDFLNETCRRSIAVFDAIDNDVTLQAYLKKVVTTSIISVLKNSGRLRRSKTGYMSTKEVPIEPTVSEHELNNTAQVYDTEKIDNYIYNVNYANVTIPPGPEEKAIRNDILSYISRTLERIDNENPEKSYMKIFIYRYQNGMTQSQIAHSLGISQSEVSKRLYGLIDMIKDILDE